MSRKLTLREVPHTDDAPPIGRGPVRRWRVDGLPDGERADIAEFNGTWRILRVRRDVLEDDAREFPTEAAAFAVLLDEYADRQW